MVTSRYSTRRAGASSSEKETSQKKFRFRGPLRYQLRTVRAYLLRGSSSSSRKPTRPGPECSCILVGQTRSPIEPIKKTAPMLRVHRVARSEVLGYTLRHHEGTDRNRQDCRRSH
jgi:hypothetical protein